MEEAFPTVLRYILLREGSLSSLEEHHGNTGQVPVSSPYTDISQRKHAVKEVQ